ncbi:FAD-dependent monooxygenase [Kocuria sp.]|uniref:FAD-dependent monooxygenase n=1 Tax=Kocuria sp. TaxID=1871328 RepID=UPI0026DCC8BE|nr:FAD-dependent monooxygenase [Kocuria sp.]MDO4919158.1 FAD-dependent monooxygenase [Kocuria sp.]
MTAPHALVSGASIAGLSTAFWLARSGWRVTVLERAPEFRGGGQNVDVRGAARGVVERMGIEAAIRAHTTTEEGTAFVDRRGRVLGAFPVTGSGGLTAELEILRGDLAEVVRGALPSTVAFRFGTTVEAVHEEPGGCTRVVCSDGREESCELLVVAEGVRSTTRDRVFGELVTRRELGLEMVYATIERTARDDRWWRWYLATDSRQVTLRPDNHGTTRATLAFIDRDADLTHLRGEALLAELDSRFRGAGWETDRVLEALRDSRDVYSDHLTQIHMPAWVRGRTVVTGDAAWCVTPLGGGGASLALLGGYVLAAFLSQHPQDHARALAEYEQWLRPLVTDSQKLPPGLPRVFYPRTAAGVRLWQGLLRMASAGPVRALTSRVSRVAETPRPLPEIVLPERSAD